MRKIFLFFKDPLYKNSFFVIVTTINNAVFGFIFWILAAKLYSKTDVGISTTLVSSMALITLISRVGLDHALVRYFPEGNRSNIFSTSIITSSILSILLAILFIVGTNIWSPDLNFLQSGVGILFIMVIVVSSIGLFTGNALIAIRRADLYFLQNIFLNFRILFIFLLLPLTFLGIYLSIGFSTLIAIAFSLFVLYKLNIKIGKINVAFLKDTFDYSSKNYLSNILLASSNYLIPLLVINLIGAEGVANFNVTFILVSYLFMIPDAICFSLFVEGSHGEDIYKNSLKSIMLIYFLLIPIVIFMLLYGNVILGIFGTSYIENFDLLKLLCVSSFLYALCSVYTIIKKVQKDVNNLIIFNLLTFSSIIIFNYLFIHYFGLLGSGYAFICGYAISSLYVLLSLIKTKGIKPSPI